MAANAAKACCAAPPWTLRPLASGVTAGLLRQVNHPRRHPTADRPLSDYDLILVMQPMTIAGALLGSFGNKLLPELVLTVALVLLLALTTKEMLQKGFAAYAKETKQQIADAAAHRESELTKVGASSVYQTFLKSPPPPPSFRDF